MGICGSATGESYRIEPDVGRTKSVDWVARIGVDKVNTGGSSAPSAQKKKGMSAAQRAHLKRHHSSGQLSYNAIQFKCIVGRGAMGTVRVGKFKDKWFAVKCIPKELIAKKQNAHRVKSEVTILRTLSHTFIVGMFAAFEDDYGVYFMLEYAVGGELWTRLAKSKGGCFGNHTARFYAAEVAVALGYLHEEVKIVYRDLKPDNLLIDADGHVKLADFGFAREVSDSGGGSIEGDACGTSQYLAPEITEGKGRPYGTPVDWWAFGCVVFEMLTGSPPFGDTSKLNKFEIYMKINEGRISYPRHIVPEAKELMKSCLCSDQNNRASWAQVRNQAWFSGINWDSLLARKLAPPFVPADYLKEEADTQFFTDWPEVKGWRETKPSGKALQYCRGCSR